MKFPRMMSQVSLLATLALVAACNGGGGAVGGGTGGTGGGGSTAGFYTSPTVSVNSFINALNNIEGFGRNDSDLVLDTYETIRSQQPGEEDWFVIWDDKFDEYKAVSLQYIRAIQYYDYYSNTSALASEFRAIEADDQAYGDLYGDYDGLDYEVVDYDSYNDVFWGVNSGMAYEDEAATTDVSLMTAELQQKEFFKKASNISFAFNVGIETSMSLVTLGEKAEKMMGKAGGELTAADQAAFATDLQRLTGVTLADVVAATQDQQAQSDLVAKIADKIGTSASNLENRLLPELFGVELK